MGKPAVLILAKNHNQCIALNIQTQQPSSFHSPASKSPHTPRHHPLGPVQAKGIVGHLWSHNSDYIV